MGILSLRGRQFARRHEPVAEEKLLVLAVEQNDLHDEIEILADERGDLGVLSAFAGGKTEPRGFVITNLTLGGGEAVEKTFARLRAGLKVFGRGGLELLVLSTDEAVDLLAKLQVLLQLASQRVERIISSRKAH